jgi:ferredoxin
MFAQILVDLLRAVRPTLSIMDGIVGMDGQGPAAGRRRSFGVIIASADPVALDAVACAVAGVDPMEIPMLRLAHEQGVGVADLSRIEVVGSSIEEVRIDDFRLPPKGDIVSRLPKPLYRMLRNHLVRKPVFIRERCGGCQSCAEACPVHAISGTGKRLRIDHATCIRCYCCQEVCPEEAIRLQMSPLRDAIEGALAIRRRIRRMIKREGAA